MLQQRNGEERLREQVSRLVEHPLDPRAALALADGGPDATQTFTGWRLTPLGAAPLSGVDTVPLGVIRPGFDLSCRTTESSLLP